MTAAFLISEIFSRQQQGNPSNLRRVTANQFAALRSMLLSEKLQGEVRHGTGGSLVWSPAGEWKYVLTEDRVSLKYTLTRCPAIKQAESLHLF